jgi:peptidylprolyl isomerase
MKRSVAFAALILLAAAGDPSSSDTVAQRGDVRLSASDVRAMLARLDPATRAKTEANAAALAGFVRDRLVDQALMAEARAKGWDQKPDVIQRANDAHDAVILQAYASSLVPDDPNFPTDADVAAAYEANKGRFMVSRQYHLSQIAILLPQNATKETEDEARRKAAELRAQAVKPKADFAEIARKHSQDRSSAEKGGDLGWLREDELLPALREPVAALPENGVSDAIRLGDGFHILRLSGTRPPAPAPLADVRPQIIEALRQARAQQAVRAYIDQMLRDQPIQLNEIDLAKQISASR